MRRRCRGGPGCAGMPICVRKRAGLAGSSPAPAAARRCSHEDCFSLASETTGVSGLAGRYAAALFDLADERRGLDEVASDLREIRAMLSDSADLVRLIRSPILSRDE